MFTPRFTNFTNLTIGGEYAPLFNIALHSCNIIYILTIGGEYAPLFNIALHSCNIIYILSFGGEYAPYLILLYILAILFIFFPMVVNIPQLLILLYIFRNINYFILVVRIPQLLILLIYCNIISLLQYYYIYKI